MSVKTTMKVVLRKAGDAWESTKEYSLLDYVIIDGQTQYVCRKVDAATGVNKGHKLTESEWWEKCADAGEMAETLESAVAELVTSADEAAANTNNAANSAAKVDAQADGHDVVVTDGEGNTTTYPTATLTDVQVDGESVVVDGVASVPKIPKMWANVLAVKDCAIKVDGKIVELPAYENVVIEDFTKVSVFCDSNYYAPEYITKFDIHNNGFAQNAVIYCNSYGQPKDSTKTYHAMSQLRELNVGGIGLSGVKDCGILFFKMDKLTRLDTGGWDTSSVTNMWDMFSNCSSLTTLDVSGFDTRNVTSMYCMFYNCSSLTTLDVSGFDTRNVTTMYCMFSGCSSLTTLDVSGFDTRNVTTMWGMFGYEKNLTNLIFGPNWGTQTSTAAAALTLDLSYVGGNKSYKLTDETWASMLTMYDRATAGLKNMTIKLNKNHNVSDGWAAKMAARGYTISY